MKHYKRIETAQPVEPFLLFEVRLDFHDVRSGFSGVEHGLFAAPPYPEQEVDWTPDLVVALDEKGLVEIAAPAGIAWPAAADERINRFFVKTYRRTIWRNPELGLYARPGETREDLLARCVEAVAEEKEAVLQQIRHMFLRRFLELEQRALDTLLDPSWEGHEVDRRAAEIKDTFSGIRESFTRCLLTPLGTEISSADLNWSSTVDVESRERLEAVRDDFVARFNQARGRLLWRAGLIEPYHVPLSHGGVDILSRGFLWR